MSGINRSGINTAPINGAGGSPFIAGIRWVGRDFWSPSALNLLKTAESGGNLITAPAKDTAMAVCERITAMRIPCRDRNMAVQRNPLADMVVTATTEGCEE